MRNSVWITSSSLVKSWHSAMVGPIRELHFCQCLLPCARPTCAGSLMPMWLLHKYQNVNKQMQIELDLFDNFQPVFKEIWFCKKNKGFKQLKILRYNFFNLIGQEFENLWCTRLPYVPTYLKGAPKELSKKVLVTEVGAVRCVLLYYCTG